MKVKEKINDMNELLSDKKTITLMVKIILSLAGGILAAVPCFMGSYSPFAASLPAALTPAFSLPCAFGAIVGIFVFQSGISAFRYFATVLTSTAILHISLYYLGIRKEKLLRPLCPGICSLIVNTAFLFSQKFSAELVFSAVAETTLTAIAVPVFLVGTKLIFGEKPTNYDLSDKELLFVVITLCTLTGNLHGIGIIGEFAAIFLFVCGILFFTFKKSFFGAAVTGVCSGFALALSGEADFMRACLTLCGILCPSLHSAHRFKTSLLLAGICFCGCAFGEYTDFFPTLPAAVTAAVFMAIVPEKFFRNRIIQNNKTFTDTSAIPLRAKEISAAVESLGDCINTVRKTLRPMIATELTTALFNAGQKVCSGCEIKESCINTIRKSTDIHYSRIASALNENRLDNSAFPESFESTCYRSEQMKNAMRQAYFVYCTNVNSQNKISRLQEITGNQLKNFGSIIAPLCASAINSGAVSSKPSRACTVCAEEMGIEVDSAQLCTNRAGHEYFNLTFRKPKDNFNVTKLTENLRRETGFELDFPTLVQKDESYTLIFKQKPKVSFKIAAAVKPASPDSVSGDYYRSFKDSFSRQVVLLSDGMGTGTRAAVDSAFTCETFCNLLRAGLDVKTAASAVNCAMLMKSTDESLATVDLFIADPVNSTLEIYKCGAAPSFILRNGRASILEAESAPMGILDKVDMARSEISVSKGDIYLTVSDGITGENWGWISAELRTFPAESPAHLAKHILQCACDRMLGKRADDMTVIALMVE